MKGWKRPTQIVIGMLVASYVVVGTYFWATQEHKIFCPAEVIAQTPASLDPPLPFQWVEIPVDEGNQNSKVHGFWMPAGDAAGPTVLYLHGRNSTVGKNLHHADCLHRMGCNVLVIDYRGFGKTFGTMTPTEASVYQDAEAAWKYLTVKREIAPNSVLLYGHSLGGAIAIELATRHPDAGGLVVEGTFTSVRNIARWKHPVTCLLPLNLLLRHPFDSIEKIRNKPLPPTLFIHGTADAKVPCDMCRQLHAAAPGPEKELLLIEEGQHADRGSSGLMAYKTKVAEFIKRYL